MKMFKSKFMLLSSLISITGACIGTGVYAYTSANTDKLELLNRAVANNTVNELKTTRSDIKVTIGMGSTHSGAIINNQLYMWGNNGYGQLGLGDSANPDTKIKVPTLVPGISGTITQLVLGSSHSGAVINNQLYMWGQNNYGESGLGDSVTDAKIWVPTRVTNIPDGSITQLALGSNHSGAIINNQLYMWGWNEFGQLGLGNSVTETKIKVPTHVTNIPDGPVTQLALGEYHSGAVIDNKLFMWGNNDEGRLGLGVSVTDAKIWVPTRVTNIPIGPITQLALGAFHSGAVIDNKLHMWGRNNFGQLGVGNNDNKNTPTHVITNIPDGPIAQLALGNTHSGAIINNQLYMWGNNSSGQLGIGNSGASTNKNVPFHVTTNNPTNSITQLVLGSDFSSVIANNFIYTWGINDSGQLGINNTTNKESPIFVNSTITYDPSRSITLDAVNDKDNLRNKLASDISDVELSNLIQQLSDKFAINLPLGTTYTISNVKSVPSFNIDGTDKGQITFDLATIHSYDQGFMTTAPLSFSNATIWGFAPPAKNDNFWLYVGLILGGIALIGIIVIIILLRRRYNRKYYESSM